MNDITFLTRQKSLTRNDQDMTARQERFDLKISKLKLLRKTKTPTSWMPLR